MTLPRADHTPDDLPPRAAGIPADPLHPPKQLCSDLHNIHPTTPSYSTVTQISPKTPSRPPDQPGSPAGWGAVDPTRAESDSDAEEEIYVPESPLSSFSFFSLEPSQHPPPSSSRRISLPRLHPRDSLSDIRKPVKYLKVLLSHNIERAVMNSSGVGRGVWVWEVCVKRAFEENMVFDNTSFHGFSYSEEYAEYDD